MLKLHLSVACGSTASAVIEVVFAVGSLHCIILQHIGELPGKVTCFFRGVNIDCWQYVNESKFGYIFRYLLGFISVKQNSAPAHRLLGQISEAQNQPQQALDSYKRSIDLDPQQNDILLKGMIY
jgi:hypothetical protein